MREDRAGAGLIAAILEAREELQRVERLMRSTSRALRVSMTSRCPGGRSVLAGANRLGCSGIRRRCPHLGSAATPCRLSRMAKDGECRKVVEPLSALGALVHLHVGHGYTTPLAPRDNRALDPFHGRVPTRRTDNPRLALLHGVLLFDVKRTAPRTTRRLIRTKTSTAPDLARAPRGAQGAAAPESLASPENLSLARGYSQRSLRRARSFRASSGVMRSTSRAFRVSMTSRWPGGSSAWAGPKRLS